MTNKLFRPLEIARDIVQHGIIVRSCQSLLNEMPMQPGFHRHRPLSIPFPVHQCLLHTLVLAFPSSPNIFLLITSAAPNGSV